MSQEIETKMLRALMVNILEHAKIAYFTISIAQITVLIGLWSVYSHSLLLAWFAASQSTVLYRYLICQRHRDHDGINRKALRQLQRQLFIAVLMNGVLWGALVWLLSPQWNIYSFIILLPILGVSAAAMNLASILSLYIALVAPIIIQVLSALIFSDVANPVAAALFFIFYIGVLGVAVATSKMLKHTYQLQFNLQAAREKADDATRLRDQFVALVSHDIRSPLMGVYNCLSMLVDNSKYSFSTQQRNDLLTTTKQTTKGLLELTEKLLDISALKSGRLELSKSMVNISTLISQVFDSFAFQADKKSITLSSSLASQSVVFADAALLKEVFSNLISNAIKFTEKGGNITVYPEPGNENIVHVKDSGLGIDEGFIKHIFDDNVQTTTAGTSREQGTGLGLPYCHHIMQVHGGDITVQSSKGAGSIFTVALAKIKNSILVVDDQNIQRNIIKKHVQEIVEVAVVEASDGIEALRVLSKLTPRLIITDIQMDGMDGMELLQRIKADDDFKAIPVIVASAVGHVPVSADEKQASIQERVEALGAAAYITKPIDPDALQKVVQRLLN